MNISGKCLNPFMLVFSLYSLNCIAEPANPHKISTSGNGNADCLACHIKQPEIKDKLNTKNNPVDLSAFHLDAIAMCTSCHAEEEGHVVGVQLNFSIPADLPLAKSKTISCLTCHYTHGDLRSSRPQASYSFMDNLLNSDRLHKSFLIRRNNVNGELCLICHNTKE